MLCVLLVERRRKKEKQLGAFFSRLEAGHALLAVLDRIFLVVRCN
jgi:hypothetical protein